MKHHGIDARLQVSQAESRDVSHRPTAQGAAALRPQRTEKRLY